MDEKDNRRPLTTRSSAWARKLAAELAQSSITPNQISLLSLFFALTGSLVLVWGLSPWSLLLCAVCAQMRLLCNLLDGMVAVEGGRQTPDGILYNELPDRVADVLFLVALGYAAQQPWLGWLAAVLAVLTAYVRVFGGSLGQAQDFRGPMAKPHRMALLTVACLIGAIEIQTAASRHTLVVAAALIAAGSLLTCVLRTRAIARRLREAR